MIPQEIQITGFVLLLVKIPKKTLSPITRLIIFYKESPVQTTEYPIQKLSITIPMQKNQDIFVMFFDASGFKAQLKQKTKPYCRLFQFVNGALFIFLTAKPVPLQNQCCHLQFVF